MAASEMFDRLQNLLLVSERLLILAENEAWDDFELESVNYDVLSQNLPEIVWSSYDAEMQSALQKMLLNIQQQHQKLLPLTQAWHNELQDLLQNQVQARKLEQKYR